MRVVARWLVVLVTGIHGLLHLLGASEGLGWADVETLEQPVSAGRRSRHALDRPPTAPVAEEVR